MIIATINTISLGTSPYHVWVCDECHGTCQYIDTITSAPYSFTLPTAYETYPSYVIKLIDHNGCVYCDTLSVLLLQDQDGDITEFQEGGDFNLQ